MAPIPTLTYGGRFDHLIDWLFPPRCRACAGTIQGRDAECFCATCWPAIQLARHPLCPLCGRPFIDGAGDDHLCGPCLQRPPRFTAARAWACYPREELDDHPLRKVVQRFKYGRKVALGKPLGRLLAAGCEEFLPSWPIDLIIPVPLHPRRLRWRGFNQSVLLARQVSRRYAIAMDPFVLTRAKETPPQTQLHEDERRKNVRGAFAVASGKSVDKKNLLLVDDVYTSGATIDECSRTLKRAGAQEVYVLTLARTM